MIGGCDDDDDAHDAGSCSSIGSDGGWGRRWHLVVVAVAPGAVVASLVTCSLAPSLSQP